MPEGLGDQGVDTTACHTFTKEINFKQCHNYRTISLISHSSQVLLRVVLNRLRVEAETLLAEEQAGFRPGRSTVEQIFLYRSTYNTCAICSTASQTSRRHLTESGKQDCGRSSEAST